MPQRRRRAAPERHELIQPWKTADALNRDIVNVEEPGVEAREDVDDLVADRHTDSTNVGAVATAEYAERKILNWEIRRGIVRGVDPGSTRRVVGFVERHVGASVSARSSSTGS